jgi:hypothetical protein
MVLASDSLLTPRLQPLRFDLLVGRSRIATTRAAFFCRHFRVLEKRSTVVVFDDMSMLPALLDDCA